MRLHLSLFLLFPLFLSAQNNLQKTITQEYKKGHFNGSILFFDGKQTQKINKGFSNIQFDVEINNNTRFPIASITKLFTSLAILQLQEKDLIDIKDAVGKFIPELPENCQNISIKDLLTHHSGLENEPIKAVVNKYTIDNYIKEFVKKSSKDTLKFNYNNVDFILLSKVIEKITKKDFSKSIEDLITKPLKMTNTGFVKESEVIKHLAYGYHNYSFGKGEKNKPLFNDRRFISNYYGAGALYSTTEDLYKLLIALRNNELISEKSKNNFLLKPQNDEFVDWISGKPTFGFYYDDKANVYRRSGNIDGFNSEIITNKDFDKILIILCNTDTADLQNLANNIYFEKQ
ncbi:serine hydrolase domain-containing protein [Flavobacterium poyangense]|uniref:serine hydrolase domain-containing protein n=1 Tax=Flavobacterium poyangense TaxID=2204302 RepID=UPI00141F1E2E|nr:serine hydrolase domain-containing protein [Flavobacterium sp. JXAS1]